MPNPGEIRGIVLELVARHGLTVIALGFLGYFVLTQAQIQQQDLAYWRETMANVNSSRKVDADRFFVQMQNMHEQLARVELYCSGKFSAQKDN